MAIYAVALLTIHDRARYERYAAGFLQTLAPYDAELVAADDVPAVVEGDLAPDKVVMLRFDNSASFHSWATSEPYRRIAADRHAAASTTVLLVRGLI